MTKLIIIGSGSACGKTFIINQVINKLPKDKITHISLDDYYKDFSNLPMEERVKVNYDRIHIQHIFLLRR